MKKILFTISLIISIIIILNLLHSIYTLWHKQDLLVSAQNQLAEEKKTNENLKKQLLQVDSQAFLEEEARDKLFLVKPGDQTVLMNPDIISPTPKVTNAQPQLPNWQQWLRVFFH